MDVGLFDFNLPTELIAQAPVRPRDSARMLHVPANGPLDDKHVRDLPDLLYPGDVMVFNDTRVIPARLIGRRGDATNRGRPESAKIEITLHQPVDAYTWRVFAKPARKLNPRDYIVFGPGFAADCIDVGDMGERWLKFNVAGRALIEMLEKFGVMPLPPYIKRPADGLESDRDDYQTMFAENDGAVAAPTAALHFTDALLANVRSAGVVDHRVTLHVGAGTFQPVHAEDTDHHQMHTERADGVRRRWPLRLNDQRGQRVGGSSRAARPSLQHPGKRLSIRSRPLFHAYRRQHRSVHHAGLPYSCGRLTR